MTDNSIRVAVRLRPLDNNEDPNKDLNVDGNNIIIDGKIFSYDYVFPGGSTNEMIYNKIVADQFSKIFEGYNLTIFAYGQTGSGKTYTMGTNYGHDHDPEKENNLGIIPRSLTCLFDGIKSKDTCTFEVKVSFLEVYNEEVYDLLHKNKTPVQCSVREDSDGFKVINLSEIPVNSAEEALSVLIEGSKYRSTASTAMNVHSSRSHSVLSINIEQRNENLDIKRSKFQLIDLAGSECAKKTKASGARFKEGININKGLLALGNVICALCEEKSHIPYRDSKLTRLLTDCFGGNSHTLMIACISSSLFNAKETLNTLRYASRARSIKNKPVVNKILNSEEHIEQLKKQVQMLEAQLLKQCNISDSSCGSENSFRFKAENIELKKNLRNALGNIASLNEKLVKTEEHFETLKGKLQSVSESIISCISILESKEDIPGEWDEILKNLNSVRDNLQTMMSPASCLFAMPEQKSEEMMETELSETSDGEMITASETSSFAVETSVQGTQISLKLQNVNLEIERNEKLSQCFETFRQVIDFTEVSPDDIKVMKETIEDLLKEKTDLENALKISEQKLKEDNEKRIKNCNAKIKQLTKEVEKSEIVARFKAEYLKNKERFKNQILSLKCARAKLIKELKDHESQHRKFKREKERELAQLKQSERKKDFEICKLKSRYDKQTSVLKQKLDYIKRLKHQNDSWNTIGTVAAQKEKIDIGTWIAKEIEIEVFSKLVAAHFDSAKENADKLVQIHSEQSHPQIELSSLQDLQSKLALQNEELSQFKKFNPTAKKGIERWDMISSMAEAKSALTAIFDKLTSSQIEALKKAEDLEIDLRSEMESEKMKYDELINNLNSEIKALKEEKSSVIKTYELKLENEKMEYQKLKLEKEKMEHQNLQCVKKEKKKNGKYLEHLCKTEPSSKEGLRRSPMEDYLESEDDSFSSSDAQDPDWRLTPLYKQRKRRLPLTESNTNIEDIENESGVPFKKPYTGCKCVASNCSSNRCKCRKRYKTCALECKCNKESCLNKDTMEVDE